MMATMFKMTMGLGVMVLAAAQVQAQGNCAPREVVIERLAERYGEARRGIGLVQQGSVMEVFASDQTGTWTITVTMPDGTTCLVASGQAYEVIADAASGAGDDA
ncbi:hypothetical protein ACFORG_04680 [Lutimaribacter marinistellae]|uniref:Uncharacterized protein n=1 Tax=Lutimaribacter marinistellae TaxID=1820329 RepID=A0ABV7TBV6_9RHOB